MTGAAVTKTLARLHAVFDVIAEEARANPGFASRLEAAMAEALKPKASRPRGVAEGMPSSVAGKPKETSETHPMLHNVTFDPLEFHIEAALLNGREHEARAFLGKLDSAQLEEVVKAQRLPGARSLQRMIQEADAAAAVDAIVGSAAERVRSRYSAAS